MDYVLWSRRAVDHGCYLNGITGYDDYHKLNKGVALESEFPDDAKLELDPAFPNNTLTPDILHNVNGFVLVSQRVKDLLAQKAIPNVEYLAVTVVDLKGKPVKPGYSIVNPVGTLPLLRVADCEATMSPLVPTKIKKLNRFVIDEAVLENAPLLFRAQGIPQFLLIHKSLAKELDAIQITGGRWITPAAIANGAMVGDPAELPGEATAKL
jgi:hypothetical protein